MAAGPMKVRLVSPEEIVFEGDAAALVAPAWDGMVGVLPHHAPMITLLGKGELTIDLPGGGHQAWQVAGGVMKVEHDEVTILTQFAGNELPEELPADAHVDYDHIIYATPGNPLA